VVALIVLGPRRLPHVARKLGNAVRELQQASNEFRHTLDEVTREPEIEPKTRFETVENSIIVGDKPLNSQESSEKYPAG
jgi:Sec-independent protein translocase protein TatA